MVGMTFDELMRFYKADEVEYYLCLIHLCNLRLAKFYTGSHPAEKK